MNDLCDGSPLILYYLRKPLAGSNILLGMLAGLYFCILAPGLFNTVTVLMQSTASHSALERTDCKEI